MVNEGGQVTFPKKWIPLSPGEELIGGFGERPIISAGQRILTFLTFGLYHFFYLRKLKKKRAAVFITT